MSPELHEPVSGRSSAVSRRSLLIGAAWAAPLVAVAAAAPFAAASGGDIEIHFDNVTVGKIWAAWPNDWGGVSGNLQIGRNGTGAEFLTQVTVMLTFENRLGLTTDLADVGMAGASATWSKQAVSVGATHTTYVFLGTGALPVYANTGILTWQIPTTITATMASIGSFTAMGFADSPEVVSSITGSRVVS